MLPQMCFCWQIEVHYWPLFTHTRIEQQASPNTVLKKHDWSFDDITAALGKFLRFDFNLTHRYSSSQLCWLCWFICLHMYIWGDLKSVNCFLFSPASVTAHKVLKDVLITGCKKACGPTPYPHRRQIQHIPIMVDSLLYCSARGGQWIMK